MIGPAAERGTADIGFATDALRGLIRAGARPRAAASVVSALTGVPANDLYRGITGRDPRKLAHAATFAFFLPRTTKPFSDGPLPGLSA